MNKELEVIETYGENIVCENCGEEEYVEITKGITVSEFCKAYECPVCGCRTMRQEMRQPRERIIM